MIRNVLVTSGGTSEPIDTIRAITNKSTGKLGSLLADAFAKRKTVDHVFYVHGKGAILPSYDPYEKITPVEIETVDDLLDAVREIYKCHTIDAVVHAMAVSDYRVSTVTNADELLRTAKAAPDRDTFVSALHRTDIRRDTKKLSSDLDTPVMVLEKTPKVLPLFRQMNPSSKIVGFKLLSGAIYENLIDTAYKLLVRSGCDYVLANDYSTVSEGKHKGYLIDSDRAVIPLEEKEIIAKGIVEALLGGETKKISYWGSQAVLPRIRRLSLLIV